MTVRVAGRDVLGPVAWVPTATGGGAAAWRTQHPVLDLSRCTGCLVCWKLCPEPAVTIEAGKVAIALAACKGCGVCAHECPVGAITMTEEAI